MRHAEQWARHGRHPSPQTVRATSLWVCAHRHVLRTYLGYSGYYTGYTLHTYRDTGVHAHTTTKRLASVASMSDTGGAGPVRAGRGARAGTERLGRGPQVPAADPIPPTMGMGTP